MKRLLLFILFTNAIATGVYSQCGFQVVDTFSNPSFEDIPGPGITPTGWNICMPGQTPDIQPGSWGVTQSPTNGTSYIGLTHLPNTNWQEGVSQRLTDSLISSTDYKFTIDIANSSTTSGGISPVIAQCLVWGGFFDCDTNMLLWSSDTLDTYDTWKTDTVTFNAGQSFNYITFQVLALADTGQPYILLDNLSPVYSCQVSTNFSNILEEHCSLSPNPTTNQLNINSSAPIEQVNIYNTTGQLMLETKQLLNNTIDVSGLCKGVYITAITPKSPKGDLNTNTVMRRWVKM